MTLAQRKSGNMAPKSVAEIRLFVRRGMSIKYLLPNSVIKYIEIHGLYLIPEPVKSVLNERGA